MTLTTMISAAAPTYAFYTACPKGLEGLLLAELQHLGIGGLRETVSGVHFNGGIADAYKVCLWSRLANKVLLPLKVVDMADEKDLYEAVFAIPWEEHLDANGSFKVEFLGTNKTIRNSQFGAVRVKDAIVDRFRQHADTRPSVSKDTPDLVINARLSTIGRNKNKVHISLDLSGQSLHRRGYRTQQGIAPLKENLAAAVLIRAQWPQIAQQGGSLVDPMCGSATLLIEGVLMAADVAPGLLREHWGFLNWLKFDEILWQQLHDEATARRQEGLNNLRKNNSIYLGYDADWRVLQAANSNISLAGLEEFIEVSQQEVSALGDQVLSANAMSNGLLICNPPYGERLGDEESLLPIYRQLGEALKSTFSGWQAGVFTANNRLAKNIGLRAKKIYKLINGTLPTDLLLFDVQPEYFFKEDLAKENKAATLSQDDNNSKPVLSFDQLTSGAQMVCNRLKKNQKQLRKWVNKDSIECYRLYDADMPEYAAAIDCYGEWIHVQEYVAPKTVDAKKAQYRFDELLSAIPVALDKTHDQIFIKQRQRNKGSSQYQRYEDADSRAMFSVAEGKARLLINLWSYLDSGLFLDHRPVRKMIYEMAHGKRFLNLFCYTATATVQAALGGATSSTSVDMSNTYLQWAQQNFEANNINLQRHQVVRADCSVWLSECREGFDLILLDPPSFSNSKKMDDVFDVQRDHVALIKRCMELLNVGGTLIFSNNLRSFKLDKKALEDYDVQNISDKTFDPDFQRNRKIHQCWLIKD